MFPRIAGENINLNSSVLKMVGMEDLKEDFPSKNSVQRFCTCLFCNKAVSVRNHLVDALRENRRVKWSRNLRVLEYFQLSFINFLKYDYHIKTQRKLSQDPFPFCANPLSPSPSVFLPLDPPPSVF